jgi:hypothetical protein
VDSGLRGLDFVGLIESVCEALEKKVDLIDVCYTNAKSLIKHEVSATGVRIYG